MNTDLTVVILVYDHPKLLDYTLWQMRNQDYFTPKLIVVDDASTEIPALIQKKSAEYYGAKYIYRPSEPKRFNKTACGLIGIENTDTEFVGIFDVHFKYDNDYLYKCMNIISKYKNMVLTNNTKWLNERLGKVKKGKMTVKHLVHRCNGNPCTCVSWTWCSKQEDIRPTHYTGIFADGNFWFRTDIASKCYDPNIYGYGNFSSDIAMSAVYYGQCVVVMGDIHTYHIEHDKVSFMGEDEQKKVRDYMELKYKSWGQLPMDNKLVLL